jgi:hypothetical protein
MPNIVCTELHTYLVGGFNPSEKYEFVSWDDEIFPTEWKVIKFRGSKAPTTINHY